MDRFIRSFRSSLIVAGVLCFVVTALGAVLMVGITTSAAFGLIAATVAVLATIFAIIWLLSWIAEGDY